MELAILWFVLLVVLFSGFFFLEGFDYGVGMLLPFVTSDDKERRLMLNSIGPVWGGNEVWMITAGGAMFAAFPQVYATLFSSFYLALFFMLVGLILRGVAIEFRSQRASIWWRGTWDRVMCVSSALVAFLWGVAVANLLKGFMINADGIYLGGFWDLISVYTVLGGLLFVAVFSFHGIAYLGLRLDRQMAFTDRLRRVGTCVGGTAVIIYVLFLFFTYLDTHMFHSPAFVVGMLVTAVIFIWSVYMNYKGRFRRTFIGSSLSIVLVTISTFAGLFPHILLSTMNPLWSLGISNASSTPYTLKIMTFAAVVFVPIVLAYQIWAYWLFKKRLTAKDDLEY